jgi:hypothetical protein
MSVTIDLITYSYVDANNARVFSSDESIVTATILSSVVFVQDGPSIPVTSIASDAFLVRTNLGSVFIPSSITSIGPSAFRSCTGLTSVSIPSSVTNISGRAFESCTDITNISIPSSVTAINDQTFYGCSGLTTVIIPSSVTSIGLNSFRYCTGLTHIAIPSSVTSIGLRAFAGCSNLIQVVIDDQTACTTVSANSFTNVASNLDSVIVFYNTANADDLIGTWQIIKNYYHTQVYSTVEEIGTGEELMAFLATEEEGTSYGNLVNSIEITSDLLAASYKQLTCDRGIQIVKRILEPG